jgi:hypothetical protein
MAKDDLPILNMSDPRHKRVLKGYIDSLDGIYRFEFAKVRDQRSLSQNAYMHGVLFTCVARGLTPLWGWAVSMDEAKRYCKEKFLRRPRVNPNTGEVKSWYTLGTHELDTEECSQFIEQVIEHCRDDLGIEVPAADEYRLVHQPTGEPAHA